MRQVLLYQIRQRANRIAIYGLFLYRANEKINISKEANCYKRHIVLSGLHCTSFNSVVCATVLLSYVVLGTK